MVAESARVDGATCPTRSPRVAKATANLTRIPVSAIPVVSNRQSIRIRGMLDMLRRLLPDRRDKPALPFPVAQILWSHDKSDMQLLPLLDMNDIAPNKTLVFQPPA